MNSNYLNQNIINEILETDRSDEQNVRTATESHQAEFPYDRDSEAQVTRREFCNFLVLTSTALFVSGAGFSAKAAYDSQREESFAPMKIEGATDLQAGMALNFRYPTPRDTAILVRAADNQFYAYGQKCTHLACPVYYSKQHDRLECPCHEGGFDVRDGRNLYGPPPRPLDKIEIEIRENGEVLAVGRKAGRNAHSI